MKRLLIFCLVLISTCALSLQAQSLEMLKTMNIDNMSDKQIEQLTQKMQSEGISMSQLDQYAAAKGVKKEDIAKLKQRIVRYNSTTGGVKKRKTTETGNDNEIQDYTSETLTDEQLALKQKKDSIEAAKPKIFGSEVFKDINLSFEANLRLATPSDYVLGPDDELLIDIYGTAEASYKAYVTPEGKIKIPNVGMITVGGLTIDEAKRVIRKRLATVYGGISSNATQVSIALGDIRSISVNVIGEIQYPGTYTIPSLATVFNALYQSGGPKESGSYREIQLIRANKVIATVDLYDFLVHGKQSNLRLRDQDAIRVLPYQTRVTLTGEVKHPAIFEMKKGETLQNLIEFAGGFSEKAYRERITVIRNTLKEKSVADVAFSEFEKFKTEAGDEYNVGIILNRFVNRVQITGAVYRPGFYALTPGMKAGDLLRKAEGLKEDAFADRAVVFRKTAAGLPAMAQFSPALALGGESDIFLQREDSIVISSVVKMKEEEFVYLAGEVMKPEKYPFAEGMTVKDLILLGNGFKHKASFTEVEVFRQIRDEKTLTQNVTKAESFKIRMSRNLSLSDSASAFLLQRDDRVIVRPQFGYEDAREVRIDGEVFAPGTYILTSKNERISDLIKKAGGTTQYAFPTGAFLIRQTAKNATEKELLNKVTGNLSSKLKKQSESGDSTKIKKELLAESDIVGINMDKILKKPGSKYDIKLEPGDVLYIPKALETVRVTGEVLRPNTVRYDSNRSFRDYVNASGGFGSNALVRKAYVIQANGAVDVTSSFFGFRFFPRVHPGSQIVVPEKPEHKGMTTAETISISTSVVSLAAIIVTLFR